MFSSKKLSIALKKLQHCTTTSGIVTMNRMVPEKGCFLIRFRHKSLNSYYRCLVCVSVCLYVYLVPLMYQLLPVYIIVSHAGGCVCVCACVEDWEGGCVEEGRACVMGVCACVMGVCVHV